MAGISAPHNQTGGGVLPDSSAFRQARRRADEEQRRARRSGRSSDLLCFEQVRDMLKARVVGGKGLRNIPLDAIAGSVGRCTDYTRSFLPLNDSAHQRWTAVKAALARSKTLPPIEVVQLGETFFVSDGHHRVSVAREQGMTSVEALVVRAEARVPLSPNVQPDDLALQAEYTSFLHSTRLDVIRPGADLRMTVLDQYKALDAEIRELHQFLQIHQHADATLVDATGQWYDQVYLPTVQIVRSQQLVREFQGRTEADLVLWLREYRASLEEGLGWEIELELAAADLVRQHRTKPRPVASAAGRVADLLGLGQLQAGPSPGAWRENHHISKHQACLFGRILVPFTGMGGDWPAVAQAAEIACRERAQLLGLHVVPSQSDRKPKRLEKVQAEFRRLCQAAGVSGTIAFDEGPITRSICERAAWADMVVLRPNHAPPAIVAAKAGWDLHTIIRRCPTPVLVVPASYSPLERPLLAYNGSQNAQEALFVAAHLAKGAPVPLTVVTVGEGILEPSLLLQEARTYLASRGVEATLIQEEGPVADALLKVAEAHGSDLIVMGGYGHSPVVELISGSVVDQVLRASKQPVLLCR